MRKLIILLLGLVLSACAIQESTLKHEGKWRAYDLSEAEVMQIVHQQMSAVENHGPITKVDEPAHGYAMRMHADWSKELFSTDEWYDVTIYVIPVQGMDFKGKTARGFVVELSGSGTYPTGDPEVLINKVRDQLDATGSSVFLVEYQKTAYPAE